jgi:folate-dependent phosphoribosylglycinamide formyltransferase PurN
MKILILTSKDHLYGNIVLRSILRSGVLDADEIWICEQSGLIPGKSFLQGLHRYISVAGIRYVAVQAYKQYLFQWMRMVAYLRNDIASPWFPYDQEKRKIQKVSQPLIVCIHKIQPDLILSVFSKEILKEECIRVPRLGVLNLHPSLLPEYRGVSPTFWALAEAQPQTGCTLHMIDHGIDTGGLIAQKSFPTAGLRTEHAVYMRCAALGSAMLLSVLSTIRDGGKLRTTPQTSGGSYRSLPTRQAIRQFYRNGKRFFSIKEFHSSFRDVRS